MKKVKQRFNNIKTGDCFPACVASILEIPIETIPNLANKKGWLKEFNKWLKENHGYYYFEVLFDDSGRANHILETYHVITGKSPNFDCQHSVVGYGGKMVHNPSNKEGELESIDGYGFFVKVFPKNR